MAAGTAAPKAPKATQKPAEPKPDPEGQENDGEESIDTAALLRRMNELEARTTGAEERATEAEKRAAAAEAKLAVPEDAEFDPPEVGERVVFRARGRNFSAVMVARNRWFSPNGEGQVTDGRLIQFADGNYETNEIKVQEFLRSLGSFNREFWEVGNEPGAVPSPKIVLEEIVRAAAALDLERINDLLQTERETHKRDVVLDQAKAAQDAVRAARS